MTINKTAAGKILYAICFLVLIPSVQWHWSRFLDEQLGLTGIYLPNTGMAITLSGIFLMAWAMLALKKYGKGLPMNAYPPTQFVKKGPYAWVRHPIYWGYSIVMTGVALYTGSGAAIRIVIPLSILSMAAIVLGYEGIFLREKFKGQDPEVLLDIPAMDTRTPAFKKRSTVFFWSLSLLLLSNFALYYLGNRTFTINSYPSISLIPEEIVFKVISLLYIFLPVFSLSQNKLLHQWIVSFVIGLSIFDFRMLFWAKAYNEHVDPFSIAESPLSFLSWINAPGLLILISGSYWVIGDIKRTLFPMIVGTGLIMYTFYAHKYTSVEMAFTILTFIASRYYKTFWKMMRDRAEQLANSWKEWTVGPVRIFSHSIYVGLGSFLGIFASGMMVGKHFAWAILIITIIVVICAAVWAQIIEGSEKLKRPFGYYGAIVGILVSGIVLRILGFEIWPMIGAISVLMPWIQAAGRLRCLVNGCCHGSITENEQLGIRYFHPRSRVCSLSGLKGKLLHPTPVYSILWLFITGILLIRLWQLHFGYAFLFGLYLILTSIGRFVEEAYRGEVQTPVWSRLRLYQWVAMGVLVTGIGFTNLDLPQKDLPTEFGWEIFAAAVIGSLFTFFAMGVDFPRSNARFSRLV